QRPLADEIALLLQAHRPADARLDGGLALARPDGMEGADIIDIHQDEARLDAGHVEGPRADGRDLMRLAQAKQRLPEPKRVLRLDPELIAQIAGEAGAIDAHPMAVHLGLENPEMGQGLDAGHAQGAEDIARGGTLEGQAAETVADLLDRDVETIGCFRQPMELMQRGIQDEIALT